MLNGSKMEKMLYTFDNKVVDQNYFTTAESRNYCLGLPGWCPCIDSCVESLRESLMEPEILNNATVLSDNSAANATITTSLPSGDNSAFTAGSTGIIEQGTAESHQRTLLSLSLKRPHGKRVASDGDSENLSSKKPLKNTGKAVKVGVEERFSFDIGKDDFESFIRKGSAQLILQKALHEWAMKNFEMWRIARNAKFVNDQCPENWYADKENLCGWLCRFVAEIQHC